MVLFRCPQCDRQLKSYPERVGRQTRCPECRTVFKIPGELPATTGQRSKRTFVDAEANEGRLSKPATKINHEELIDMTAMVDIVFFLLIFFLVTSMSGIQSSAPLPRPESNNDEGAASSRQSVDPQRDPNAIVVKIGKDDSIEIDGVPYREISDLTDRLIKLRSSGGDETSMLVLGDGDASHGAAVAVLDAGYEAGINKLQLAVIDDGQE